MRILVVAFVVAVALATLAAPSRADGCKRVKLDAGVYGQVDKRVNVGCPIARVIVREWGGQQVGAGTADLPRGWSCNARSVCRKGKAKVTMILVYS